MRWSACRAWPWCVRDRRHLPVIHHHLQRAVLLTSVGGFVLGAFLGVALYMRWGFWSVLPFMLAVLYLASLSFRRQFG